MAWLRSLSPTIVPIPGVTRRESVLDNIAALKVSLTTDEIAQINAGLPETMPLDHELIEPSKDPLIRHR